MLLHFMLYKMFLKLSSFFKIIFSFSCSAWVIFSTLSSKSLIQSCASSNLQFLLSSVLFTSNITFFTSDWSFFLQGGVLCLFSFVKYHHYLEFRSHTSQGECPSCWNIPPELQLSPVGAQPALSHLLCIPYQSHVLKQFLLLVLGFKDFLQLVFCQLFRVISLQFSCNSSLVLGGG